MWHNAICVYKGSTNQDIYIDGVLRNGALQNVIEASITSTSINNKIGFDSYAGSIDEVAIWNRSLTAAEINQSYMSNLYKYDTNKWALTINQTTLNNLYLK